MKTAIVTIASGEYFLRMAALTHPSIKAYAAKIGADFIFWNDTAGYTIAEYKKTEIAGLLDVYDRVLYVDTDVIIRADAPDIFAVVPEDHLGMLEESEFYDRRMTVLRFMNQVGFDSALWNGKYYNAGIFVCSRCHRDVLVRPPTEWDHFRDQTWFNTLIADRKAKVFSLPYRFNRILTFDRFFGESRLDAWFLHYAGVRRVLSAEELLELIKNDLDVWRHSEPAYKYPDHIAIVIQGGLGDQVAAEPAVRYARDVIYRGDDVVLVSAWPEIFAHLGLKVFETFDAIPSKYMYHQRFTRTNPDVSERHALSRHQVHGTSLASLVALGVELPLSYRTPQLRVSPSALASVTDKLAPADVGSLVLVHPGRGTPSVTFPADVWRSYADALVAGGHRVAVIGKRLGAERGIVDFDRSGCIDLVDRLSVEELIALVSRSRVLVSNDSAPVQIAGAFGNWIGLIATARHPEYVLPWRNGSLFWRARNLERLPVYYDYFHKPSSGTKPALDACDPPRLRMSLPELGAIAEFVRSALDKA